MNSIQLTMPHHVHVNDHDIFLLPVFACIEVLKVGSYCSNALSRIELLYCQQDMLFNLLYTMALMLAFCTSRVSSVLVVVKNVTPSRPTSCKSLL